MVVEAPCREVRRSFDVFSPRIFMHRAMQGPEGRSMIARVWELVLGEPVKGQRTGHEQYRVRCPFHEDRHPSCDVSLAKDAFLCRSCGAAGGYTDVVIRAGYAQTKAEAMRWLARHGVRP